MKVAEANAHLAEFAESLEMLCSKLVLISTTGDLTELFEMCEVECENSHVLHKLMKKVNGLKKRKEVSSPHSEESPTPSKKKCFSYLCSNYCSSKKVFCTRCTQRHRKRGTCLD